MLTLQISTQHGARHQAAAWGRLPGVCRVEIALPRRRSAGPRPTELATGLERPICDGVSVQRPSLAAAEAGRGFAAGTFYLPGQIVDRTA